MAHAVLEEKKEKIYFVELEEENLKNLLTSEQEEYLCETDPQKVDNVIKYANYHEELIDINKVKQKMSFGNLGVY